MRKLHEPNVIAAGSQRPRFICHKIKLVFIARTAARRARTSSIRTKNSDSESVRLRGPEFNGPSDLGETGMNHPARLAATCTTRGHVRTLPEIMAHRGGEFNGSSVYLPHNLRSTLSAVRN